MHRPSSRIATRHPSRVMSLGARLGSFSHALRDPRRCPAGGTRDSGTGARCRRGGRAAHRRLRSAARGRSARPSASPTPAGACSGGSTGSARSWRGRARGTSLSQLRKRLRRLRAWCATSSPTSSSSSRDAGRPALRAAVRARPGPGGISAPPAWDRRTKCSLVAVLDSGTQYDHPDLKDNIWHNSGETKNNGKDDDRNGYVDDYYGADVTDEQGQRRRRRRPRHARRGDHRRPRGQRRGHRRRVLVGEGHAGPVHGLAAGGARRRTPSPGSTTRSTRARRSSTARSARRRSPRRCRTRSKHAQDKGVLLVVAAGNDGDSIESKPVYPASFTNGNILTVAATTQRDSLASFSNYGSKSVDLAAPGDDIHSTYPKSAYKSLDGTSMAAPLVAAAAAMLRAADSDLSYKDLRSALKATVDPLPALAGQDGDGRADQPGTGPRSRVVAAGRSGRRPARPPLEERRGTARRRGRRSRRSACRARRPATRRRRARACRRGRGPDPDALVGTLARHVLAAPSRRRAR